MVRLRREADSPEYRWQWQVGARFADIGNYLRLIFVSSKTFVKLRVASCPKLLNCLQTKKAFWKRVI
jgi:hypothetical protein